MNTDHKDLPPLPEPFGEIQYRRSPGGEWAWLEGYSINQMHAYARAAIAADRAQRVVNLESLQVSAPESMDDRRERIRSGRVAEMADRQAGL